MLLWKWNRWEPGRRGRVEDSVQYEGKEWEEFAVVVTVGTAKPADVTNVTGFDPHSLH